MRPAFSVILLTTLIGAGQGLFLALFTVQSLCAGRPAAGRRRARRSMPGQRDRAGAAGRPGWWPRSSTSAAPSAPGARPRSGAPRGCRARSSCCRRSWPRVALYGAAHAPGLDARDRDACRSGLTIDLERRCSASLGTVLAFALFVCTGMVYACLRFLAEWHTPLTLVNYTLLGGASGFMLAAAWASLAAPDAGRVPVGLGDRDHAAGADRPRARRCGAMRG